MSAPLETLLKREQIDDLAERYRQRAPWLTPILEAMRHGAGMMIVTQRAGPFRLPRGMKRKPTIALIGDDLHEALGPAGFHLPSLRRLLRQLSGVAVVSSAATAEVYAAAAAHALMQDTHVGIIETRIEQEIPWLDFVQKTARRLPILLSTVKGGTA